MTKSKNLGLYCMLIFEDGGQVGVLDRFRDGVGVGWGSETVRVVGWQRCAQLERKASSI